MDPETPKTKTVTARQLAANRANARKSTGPRTRQGKLRSAYNRLEHGLAAATVVLPGEDAERFDWLRQETMEIFSPANSAETQLASLFAAAQWRCERAVLYETAVGLEGRAKWDREIKTQFPGVSEPFIDGLIFGRRATAPEDRTLQCLDRRAYSSLSSRTGSTPSARCAGTHVATAPTRPIAMTAQHSTTGSLGEAW